MAFSFDDQPFAIECPKCGKAISKTIGWFKRSGQRCPHRCGTTIDTTEFRKGIEEAEREFERFARDLGKP